MKNILVIFLIAVTIACNSSTEKSIGQQSINKSNKFKFQYSGEGDIIEFKMFEGLYKSFEKNSSGVFEGQIDIPNIEDAIFSYDLIVYKKDSLGKMTEIEYTPESKVRKNLVWIGKNRNISFTKTVKLNGVVTREEFKSEFLEGSRNLTIYNPNETNEKTPIIYMTDGSVVNNYAPYVDKMISEKRIIPIILVGVHSSQVNRYKEYVDNGIDNYIFQKYENFFYNELLTEIEDKIKNWNGKRYIYGFSNGAAFVIHAGINHPKIFEEVIAFSTTDYISEFIKPIKFKHQNYPKFYMGVGKYEKSIFRDNLNF